MGTVPELQIRDGKSGEFADPQPGLDGKDQQRMVSTPDRGRRVWCSEQRIDLLGGEEVDEHAVVAFDGDKPRNTRTRPRFI